MGTKNNPGKYDCYEGAEPDEPMFVLLARDPGASRLVRAWADARQARAGASEKVDEARACAAAMEAWREENRTAPAKKARRRIVDLNGSSDTFVSRPPKNSTTDSPDDWSEVT